MDDDFFWSDKDISRLHGRVCAELQSVFHHDERTSEKLLADWLDKRPQWTPDNISHDGPFDVALRIQYDLVEGLDSTSLAYLEWRQRFKDILDERRNPKLTPMQEAILRERGAL